MAAVANSLQDAGEAVSLDELRWTPINGRKDPAIIIQRRGKDRRVLATISKNGKFASHYQSWQPVIERWKAEREQTGKRTDHAKLGAGAIPE